MNVALPEVVTNLTKPTRYIGATETAKLIRQALKEAWPEVKFSVVTDKYAGGASIRVRYQAPIASKEVKAIAGVFEGAGFDGMQDLKYYKKKTMNGEPVSFGGCYVFVDRDYDKAKEKELVAILEKVKEVTPQEKLENVALNLLIKFGVDSMDACRVSNGYFNAWSLAYAILAAQVDPKLAGRKSKLADSVCYLGED